jgi:methyl-accepting chemotaxis protein
MESTMGGAAQSAEHLRAGIAILGFTAIATGAAMTKAFADFEKESAVAAAAATSSMEGMRGTMDQLRNTATDVARSVNEMPDEALGAVRMIQQFGDVSESTTKKLAEAGLTLAKFGDTNARTAITALFRLTRATRDADQSMDQLLDQSFSLASAMKLVSDQSAGGVDGMIEFIQAIQSTGVQADLARSDLIAIAGAMTDLDERARRVTRSTITRLFLKRIPQAEEEVQSFLETFATGATEAERALLQTDEGLTQLFREDPFRVFTLTASAFRELTRQVENNNMTMTERGEILKEIGLQRVRGLRTLSTMAASLDKVTKFRDEANEEIERGVKQGRETTELHGELQVMLETTAASFRKLGLEVSTFARQGGALLAGVFEPMIDALSVLTEKINQIPFIAPLLAGGGVISALGLAGVGAVGIFQKMARPILTQGLETIRGAFGGQAAKMSEAQTFQALMQSNRAPQALQQAIRQSPETVQGLIRSEAALQKAQARTAKLEASIGQLAAKGEDVTPVMSNLADEMAQTEKAAKAHQRAMRRFQQAAVANTESLSARMVSTFRTGMGRMFGAIRGEISRVLGLGAISQTRFGQAVSGAASRLGSVLPSSPSAMRGPVPGRATALGMKSQEAAIRRGAQSTTLLQKIPGVGRAFRPTGPASMRLQAVIGKLVGGVDRFVKGFVRRLPAVGGSLARVGTSNILALVGFLEPALDKIADLLGNLRDQSGLAGLAIEGLIFLFRGLETAGSAVNLVFRLIIDAVKGILRTLQDLSENLPVVGGLFDMVNEKTAGFNEGLAQLSDRLDEVGREADKASEDTSDNEESSDGGGTTVDVNVDARGSRSSEIGRETGDAVSQTVFGTGAG